MKVYTIHRFSRIFIRVFEYNKSVVFLISVLIMIDCPYEFYVSVDLHPRLNHGYDFILVLGIDSIKVKDYK